MLWFSAPSWLSHTELIDCSQEKLQRTKRSFPISANLYAGLNSISRDSNEQYLAQEYLDHPITYSAVNHTTTHIGSRRDAAADVGWLRQSKFHKNFSSLTYLYRAATTVCSPLPVCHSSRHISSFLACPCSNDIVAARIVQYPYVYVRWLSDAMIGIKAKSHRQLFQ